MKNKKVLCIHHNDSDGRLAAAIVKRRYLVDAELIEVGYNDYKEKLKHILECDVTPSYAQVFIVDFSMDKEDMEKLLELYKIVWCDHHKSAMEKLQFMWEDKKILGNRSMDKCGAMLVNEYLGNESFEELVLVDDYDRWVKNFGDRTEYFAEVNKHWSINQWMVAIGITDSGSMDIYYKEGRKLYIQKLERIELAIKKGLSVIFKNKKTLLINNTNTMDSSLLGNTICERGYDIALMFEFNKNKVTFGLRSIGDLDVSLIAKEFGGGGHKNASGFVVDYAGFNDILLTIK